MPKTDAKLAQELSNLPEQDRQERLESLSHDRRAAVKMLLQTIESIRKHNERVKNG